MQTAYFFAINKYKYVLELLRPCIPHKEESGVVLAGVEVVGEEEEVLDEIETLSVKQ
jgi:hypothetical protein